MRSTREHNTGARRLRQDLALRPRGAWRAFIALLIVGGAPACNEYITPASESALPRGGSGGVGAFGGFSGVGGSGGLGGALDPSHAWEGVGGCIPGTEVRSHLGPDCVHCMCAIDSPGFRGAPCGPDCWARLRCESAELCDPNDWDCLEPQCGRFPATFTDLVRPLIAECTAECPEVAGAVDTTRVAEVRLGCRENLVAHGSEHCAQCACEPLLAATLISGCGGTCWDFIHCARRECSSPTPPDSYADCLHSLCAEFRLGALDASAVFPILESCGCDLPIGEEPIGTAPDAGPPID